MASRDQNFRRRGGRSLGHRRLRRLLLQELLGSFPASSGGGRSCRLEVVSVTVLGSRCDEKIQTARGAIVGGLGGDAGGSQGCVPDGERGGEVNRLFRIAVIWRKLYGRAFRLLRRSHHHGWLLL